MMNNANTDVGRRNVIAAGASTAIALPLVLAAASQPAMAQTSAGIAVSPTTDPAFDPKNFPVLPPKRFSDFKVGDMFRMPSRSLTVALTSAFQAVSLDNNPLHYDDDYARQKGLPSALVQPMEVLAFSAPGASVFTLYLADILIAFEGLSCKFLKPSFVGDTLYVAIQITEMTAADGKGRIATAVTIHNQKGELVLTGQQTYAVKLSPGERA